ncbi:bifunctional YncE family protein/alkaline phosphatase family protein [Paraliomyxa miuraensis]|uniref:bifunctional YncE family protein/alkaline phosphatase family protein n=1 Tax=Paraliomyxa miuraensis TaxID=376150 RepID=UPI0022511D41|nr:bifunctional YncE family protein/alkaline phosphatase family protein [Paraliomyxa miuraensis]MCX4240922.1 bifunctional YncE family protein/alkaline phosphatase family protein [Paraliomyxa miuraensis]
MPRRAWSPALSISFPAWPPAGLPAGLLAGLLAGSSACNDGPTQTTDAPTTGTGTEGTGGSTTTDTSGVDSTGTPIPDMVVPPQVGCVADPVDAATQWPGVQDDGSTILVNGRRADSLGESRLLRGYGFDVAVHPTAEVAYVTTASREDRRLYVIDRSTGDIVQDIDRQEAYYGLLVSPDGSRLYASNGVPGGIEYFDVAADGMVTSAGEVPVGGWTAGMAGSPDGATLWVASFDANRITEVDTATMTVTRTLQPGVQPWDVLYVPSRNELWSTDFTGEDLSIFELDTDMVGATVPLPTSPSMMVLAEDESRVFVSVTGADQIVAVDTVTRAVVGSTPVAEADFVDAMGQPLPHSNVNALWVDGPTDRLYAARGSDSAIGVFEASTLTPLGSIPTRWYPTGVAGSPDGQQLVVSELRANGSRSRVLGDAGDHGIYRGGVSIIDLQGFELADATNEVISNFRRPLELAVPPDCGSDFPLPLDYGGSPAIEHVVLIVNENQTFDALFGESAAALGVEADPAYLKWEQSITVNKRALAERFVIGDHFFTDSQESDMGHTFLTATHWTEWVERINFDRDEYDVLQTYPISPPAIPDRGNFFSWLLDNGKSIQIYGEIVGILHDSTVGPVSQFSDIGFPGGTIINYDVQDVVKAQYVASEVAAGELADFTFLSLPNDHGQGVSPGVPTPQSMTADNDAAVGIVVDAISHSPFWESTVIIVLQDDPQGSDDHIDESRSPLLVISPWVRRGYVSHAHYSFSSVFATIERLLGVPPLGRPDASAAPMWDMFTDVPDFEPYDAIPREYPEEVGRKGDPGIGATRCMDFRGPDRNPELGFVVDQYLAFRRGELTAKEAEARIRAELANPTRREEAEEEREEELSAHAQAVAAYEALRAEHPELPPLPELPARMAPAAGCRRVDRDD